MLIRLPLFKGMAPSIRPDQLADQMAQLAVNCRLNMGSIMPLRNIGSDAVIPSKAGTTLSIFKYLGTEWLDWIDDVNVCRSALADDSFQRVYWTGDSADDGTPKYSVNNLVHGAPPYPSVAFRLGVPKPITPPSWTVDDTGRTSTDPTLAESRTYVYTYVTTYGEEGLPSSPSAVVTVYPGDVVTVSGLESGPSTGSYSIDFLRIYRTNTGTTGTEYQLVVELDHAAGSFIDTVANSDLQEVLPSASWAPPPPDMRGLISLPSGSLAGFSGKVYCESMPYLPHAWPASYQVPVDAPIIMIGSYGNNVLVVTEGQPYVMTGQAGSRMTEKLEIGYACVSKRGFVDMGYACIYPAVNGLMLVGMGDVRLVSANLLTQKDWEAFNPETIHAYLWDGKYVAFWTNSSGYEGFIFDPATQDLTLHSVPATAGYTEPATGKLFICSEGEIKEWDGNISYLTATWKSKEYILPNPLSPSCGQVFASAYPVTFKLYLDGVLHYTRSVANSKPFRVLGGKLATKCSVEIESNTTISQVLLSDSMAELARV